MINKLLNGLSDQDLKKFHEKVLYIIENIGIQVDHEKMLKRLSDHPWVHIKGKNVTFDSDLVDSNVFNIEFDMPEYFSDDNFTLISGNMNPTIKDGETGKIRLATQNDLVFATKLEDSLGVTGTAAVTG